MGIEYRLINQTKKELISFAHLNGAKTKELAGNVAQSSIVTWYMLNNMGDDIQFVSDSGNEWLFNSGVKAESAEYKDQTEAILAQLIDAGILKDNGYLFIDEYEPETMYVKDIINIWNET